MELLYKLYSLRRKDSALLTCSADGVSSIKLSNFERNSLSFIKALNGIEIEGHELLHKKLKDTE